MATIVMWSLLIVPWLSLFFLDRSTVRKYMPVTLLAVVFSTIINQIAWAYNWWQFKPLFSWDKVIPVYMVYGVFMIGTLWIFVFTYKKFWLYLVVNFLVDLFFGLVLGKALSLLGIRASGNLSMLQDLMMMTAQGIILYGYQMWQDGITVGGKSEGKGKHFEMIKVRSKEKAK